MPKTHISVSNFQFSSVYFYFIFDILDSFHIVYPQLILQK